MIEDVNFGRATIREALQSAEARVRVLMSRLQSSQNEQKVIGNIIVPAFICGLKPDGFAVSWLPIVPCGTSANPQNVRDVTCSNF